MGNKGIIFGVIIIVIGLFLWFRAANIILFGFADAVGFIFPLGLIAAGIWLISRHRKKTRSDSYEYREQTGKTDATSDPGTASQFDYEFNSHQKQTSERPEPIPSQPHFNNTGKLKYDKFFGDMFVDCSNANLQSVDISVFIGDVEVKLHGGQLAPGLNRMVISGFIGDVRILIPPDMAIYVQSSNFIGDIELLGRRTTGFGNNLDIQTPGYQEAESKLYIASNQFIGDVRVYVV